MWVEFSLFFLLPRKLKIQEAWTNYYYYCYYYLYYRCFVYLEGKGGVLK